MEKIPTTEEELKEKIMAKFIEYDAWDEDDKVRLRETYADEILALIRDADYMSPEMVKGLIFEVQAKKCASCPKNKEPQ